MWVFTVPHFGKLELKDLTLTLELRTELLFSMPPIDFEFFPFKKKTSILHPFLKNRAQVCGIES